MEIKFSCRNCGNQVEKEILPMKHAVIGILRKLDQEQDCCTDPSYRDSREYHLETQRKPLRELVNGLVPIK